MNRNGRRNGENKHHGMANNGGSENSNGSISGVAAA